MSLSAITRRGVLTVVAAAMLAGWGAARPASADHQEGHRIGLDGYCPVCIVAARKWEAGRADINSTYDGVIYQFPNQTIKAKFDANPAAYVPALGGDCIVCYAKAGKRMPVSVHHAAVHNGRLYLFPSDREKKVFVSNPSQFEDVDLAAKGECVVCLAKAGKHVPGKAQFTEIHNGFRYLFPSAREQAEFRRAPQQYAAISRGSIERTAMKQRPQVRQASVRTSPASFAGRSGCAACEHGVTPIGSPDELGLAINMADGQVIVVEGAHKLYPEVYAARFEGQPLRVAGKVIKTEGKVTWLQPASLEVVK